MEPPAIRSLRPLTGGAGEASVDMVQVGDRQLVLKRQSVRHANAERLFHRALADAGRPHLEVVAHPALDSDQLLLEHVDGSPTVGRSKSPATFEAWGAAIAGMHGVGSDHCQAFDECGQPVVVEWAAFLGHTLAKGLQRQGRVAGGFAPELLEQIAERLARLSAYTPKRFALCHGDLHMNNALLRGEEVVLFDKGADAWMAPAVFDLAVIFSEAFPGARYLASSARVGDDERMAAFMRGYGSLPSDEGDWIDGMVVLRSLGRYPNPFVPDLLATVEAALERF